MDFQTAALRDRQSFDCWFNQPNLPFSSDSRHVATFQCLLGFLPVRKISWSLMSLMMSGSIPLTHLHWSPLVTGLQGAPTYLTERPLGTGQASRGWCPGERPMPWSIWLLCSSERGRTRCSPLKVLSQGSSLGWCSFLPWQHFDAKLINEMSHYCCELN